MNRNSSAGFLLDAAAHKKGELQMKPLEGIRVLDFSQFMAGPMATLILSDLGAEVIKLENAKTGGDATRYGKVIQNGVSSHYATRNRGKKSVVINMKDPEQVKLFLKLVKTADVVMENFKPGTMEKFGVTYDVLKEINPKITYVRISGYGQEGPYSSHAAYDATIQAEAGVVSITGPEGSQGYKCGASIGDYSGAVFGAVASLAGIAEAARTGHGRCYDISMMDALLFLQENQLSVYLATGKIPVPSGNRYPQASPVGDFMCKDGIPVMLNIATDKQFANFANVLGQPQWLANPHFASMSLRAAHYKEMEAEVNRVFAELTSDEVCEKLQSVQSVYGRINNYQKVCEHPQVEFRHSFVTASYDNGVQYKVPGNPLLLSGEKRQTEYRAAELGENTYEVLGEVCDQETLHRIMDPSVEQAKKAAAAQIAKAAK